METRKLRPNGILFLKLINLFSREQATKSCLFLHKISRAYWDTARVLFENATFYTQSYICPSSRGKETWTLKWQYREYATCEILSTRKYSNNQTYVTNMQTILIIPISILYPLQRSSTMKQEVSERQILIGVYPLHMASCNPVTSTCSGDIALSTASRRCCSLKYWKAWKGCEMPQNLEMNV